MDLVRGKTGMRPRGFTLTEVVLIIAIIGILAISALPRFLDLSKSSEEVERDGVVSAVRAAVALYHINKVDTAKEAVKEKPKSKVKAKIEKEAEPEVEETVWPGLLDENGDGPCTACFSKVLEQGLDDSRWIKEGFDYSFTTTGGSKTTYAYDPSNGTFEERD